MIEDGLIKFFVYVAGYVVCFIWQMRWIRMHLGYKVMDESYYFVGGLTLIWPLSIWSFIIACWLDGESCVNPRRHYLFVNDD